MLHWVLFGDAECCAAHCQASLLYFSVGVNTDISGGPWKFREQRFPVGNPNRHVCKTKVTEY